MSGKVTVGAEMLAKHFFPFENAPYALAEGRDWSLQILAEFSEKRFHPFPVNPEVVVANPGCRPKVDDPIGFVHDEFDVVHESHDPTGSDSVYVIILACSNSNAITSAQNCIDRFDCFFERCRHCNRSKIVQSIFTLA